MRLGSVVALIQVSVAFYRLFKDVDWMLAVMLGIFGGVMQSAIYFFNVANDEAALMFVRDGTDYLSVFTGPQRDALAYFFVRLHFQVILGAEILWSLWLFPMAILILKSRWFPRLLDWWLFLDGTSYFVITTRGSSCRISWTRSPTTPSRPSSVNWRCCCGS